MKKENVIGRKVLKLRIKKYTERKSRKILGKKKRK